MYRNTMSHSLQVKRVCPRGQAKSMHIYLQREISNELDGMGKTKLGFWFWVYNVPDKSSKDCLKSSVKTSYTCLHQKDHLSSVFRTQIHSHTTDVLQNFFVYSSCCKFVDTHMSDLLFCFCFFFFT